MTWLASLGTALLGTKAGRWIAGVAAALAAIAILVWRMTRSAEERGGLKVIAKANKETLRKIGEANRAEVDANSGSARDERLHDRFDRD